MAVAPLVDSKPLNVMAWIKERTSLLSDRRIEIAQYVNVSKFHRNMDESEFTRNLMETTLKTLTETRLRAVSEALSEVEAITSADITIGEGSEQSQVEMKVDVVRAEAKLSYKGDVDAELRYQIGSSQMQLEVSRAFGKTRVVASHMEKGSERTERFGVRWSF